MKKSFFNNVVGVLILLCVGVCLWGYNQTGQVDVNSMKQKRQRRVYGLVIYETITETEFTALLKKHGFRAQPEDWKYTGSYYPFSRCHECGKYGGIPSSAQSFSRILNEYGSLLSEQEKKELVKIQYYYIRHYLQEENNETLFWDELCRILNRNPSPSRQREKIRELIESHQSELETKGEK